METFIILFIYGAPSTTNPLSPRVKFKSQDRIWFFFSTYSMMSRTDLIISDKAFTKVGFDDGAGRILPGVLGEGTLEMVQECLSEVLQEEGMSPCEADKVVRECIEEGGARFGETKPIGDVTSMFKRLKHSGFQIAINTSDSREATLDNLHRLGVSKLVDNVVCGDDDWMIAKPHPLSAFMICAQLGVQPENAVMVGDSPCDVRLGINAQLGCSIGKQFLSPESYWFTNFSATTHSLALNLKTQVAAQLFNEDFSTCLMSNEKETKVSRIHLYKKIKMQLNAIRELHVPEKLVGGESLTNIILLLELTLYVVRTSPIHNPKIW